MDKFSHLPDVLIAWILPFNPSEVSLARVSRFFNQDFWSKYGRIMHVTKRQLVSELENVTPLRYLSYLFLQGENLNASYIKQLESCSFLQSLKIECDTIGPLNELTHLQSLDLKCLNRVFLPVTLQTFQFRHWLSTANYPDFRVNSALSSLSVKNLSYCLFLPTGLQNLSLHYMTEEPKNLSLLTRLSELHILCFGGGDSFSLAADIPSLEILHVAFEGGSTQQLRTLDTHPHLHTLHLS
jgi:hypothetical protein